ncbi:MAG: N-acetyltransferase [Flavobacteriaceae bacterium]|nr:N-acetyltransferase [Flavobacteriaceae bacterium]
MATETYVTEIKDNDFLRQFECVVDHEKATIEYALQERKIFLTKLNAPEALQNEDFKNEFVMKVLAHVQQRKLRVVPTSPFIAKFFKQRREYREMLSVGIKL